MSTGAEEGGHVVVAVDGSESGASAVRFAANQARHHHLAVRLVHVVPAYLPIGPLLMVATEEGLDGFASETVQEAARVVADVAPQVPVTTQVLLGGRVAQISRVADDAALVVVGRRPGNAIDRIWSGGTLDGVVSRVHVPVYVVPSETARAPVQGRVVAGFKGLEHASELMEAAFAAADDLGADLEVLHAWKLPACYDDAIAHRVSEATWNRSQKAVIREALEPWRDAYPTVRIRIRVVHDFPVRALVEASRTADRLVLVKPLHGGAVHHLGRTARGALRLARCPVEVVPASPLGRFAMAPVVLERAGELVR